MTDHPLSDAEIDRRLFEEGFEWFEQGDGWGWRARFETVQSAHVFATKAEAWANLRQAYPNIEDA